VKGRALRISNAVATTLALGGCAMIVLPLQAVAAAPTDVNALSTFDGYALPIGLVSVPFIALYLRFTNDPIEHIPLFLRVGGVNFGARACFAALGLGFLVGGFRAEAGRVEGLLGLALLCGAGVKWAVDEWRFRDDYPEPLWDQVRALWRNPWTLDRQPRP
jgi:hypothetical protein